MTITLLQLRTQARDRADMTNSKFVSDSELNTMINASIAELHDLMIGAYDSDYYITEYAFNSVANTSSYALPSDFYKLRGVDIKINNDNYFTIQRFNFNERNRNTDTGWGIIGGPNIRYNLVGNNLKLLPAPDGVYACKLWYIPVAVKLVSDSDTLADFNQYAEYIVLDAAIKMKEKEESDVQTLMVQKMAMQKRIIEMAQNRDAGSPEAVSDIYAENNDYYFFRNS